jgi:hypothetical protein
MPGPSEIEIRPLYEAADVEALLTPVAKQSRAGSGPATP